MLVTLSLSLPAPLVPHPSLPGSQLILQEEEHASGRRRTVSQEAWQWAAEAQCQEFGCQGLETKNTKWICQGQMHRGHSYGKEVVRGNEVRVPVTPELLGQVEHICPAPSLLGWKGQFSSEAPAQSVRSPGPHSRMLKGHKDDLYHVLHPGMAQGGFAHISCCLPQRIQCGSCCCFCVTSESLVRQKAGSEMNAHLAWAARSLCNGISAIPFSASFQVLRVMEK